MRLEELTRNQLEDLMIRYFPDEPTEKALPKVKEMFVGADFVEEDFWTDRTHNFSVILYDTERKQFLVFTKSYSKESTIVLELYKERLDTISNLPTNTTTDFIKADDKKSLIENVISYLTNTGCKMSRFYDIDEEEWRRLCNIKLTYEETVCKEIQRYIGQ